MPKVSEEYYEKKRKEIIDAAYRVCVRKPITSVEMKDIIAETGFSHGVIYRYYKDLDEVLKDLVITINANNTIDEKLDAILKKAKPEQWEKTIRAICRMLADQMKEVGTDLLKVSIYSSSDCPAADQFTRSGSAKTSRARFFTQRKQRADS